MLDIAGGALTPKVTVYDSSGAVVANFAAGDVAYAAFTTTSTGTFTVVVTDNAGTASGAYRLNLAAAPGSNKDGPLTNGGVATGTIEKGELDSYTFTANAG